MAASGFQAEKSLKDTVKNNKGKYILLCEGAVPTDDGGVYCMIGGQDRRVDPEGSLRGRGRGRGMGQLRLESVACRRPSPIRRTRRRSSKLVAQAGDQRAWLPADRRRDDGVVTHRAGARADSGNSTRWAGRRNSTAAAYTTRAIAGRTTTPACSSSRSDDENARKGYCLYKMGCQRAGHVQRLLGGGVERRYELPDPVGTSAASAAAKKASGTTDRSINTSPTFPGFGIESTADTVGTVRGAATARRCCGARGGHQRAQEAPSSREVPRRRSEGVVSGHDTHCCRSRHSH